MTEQPETIFCVDDDLMVSMALVQELKNHFGDRFQYASVHNVQTALLELDFLIESGEKIAVILADYLMPPINGDYFLMKVREKYPLIPTIIISGYSEKDFKTLNKEVGAYALFPKPWNREELFAAINACCEKNK